MNKLIIALLPFILLFRTAAWAQPILRIKQATYIKGKNVIRFTCSITSDSTKRILKLDQEDFCRGLAFLSFRHIPSRRYDEYYHPCNWQADLRPVYLTEKNSVRLDSGQVFHFSFIANLNRGQWSKPLHLKKPVKVQLMLKQKLVVKKDSIDYNKDLESNWFKVNLK